MDNLEKLVMELCKSPHELPYLEFKHDNYDPYTIGENISALANSATLYEHDFAYMLWGVRDDNHEIVGTNYNLQSLKKESQELENWLRSLLSSNANFEFKSVKIKGKNVGVLIIHAAFLQTVTFQKIAYIRVGSYTKKLKDYPALESALWKKILNSKFEDQSAKCDLDLQHAINLLNIVPYFTIQQMMMPLDYDKLAHYLMEDNIINKQDNGLYGITNLGAILFAKQLSDFPNLSLKNVRVIQYDGNNRLNLIREKEFSQGYVTGLEEIIKYVDALLPAREEIGNLFRQEVRAYPPVAVREVIANSLIHQDFSLNGTNPLIEIFKNRLEVTNPGTPLVDIARIIDNPPKSRNDKLAHIMRRLKMCEELGTGWDRIVISCERALLPAPRIELYESNTKVTLFEQQPFSSISLEDKLHSCYMHACIKYVQNEQLTNSSLRTRFGLKSSSSGVISRLIKDAVSKNYIKPFDSDTAPKHMRYIPFWA